MVCRGSRPILLPSTKYKEWHADASDQITKQEIEPVKGPLRHVLATFFSPDLRKFDLSNKFESVADLLVDNGIIEDDNYAFMPSVHMIYGGVDREDPRVEVVLNI